MASQELASQPQSTPAMPDDTHVKGFDKAYVCRLLAFDETRSGAMMENVFLKPNETITFGRNKDCSYRLTDSYVSGLHCKIWHQKKDNELWIKDYSSNGTFIDGRRIGKGNTTTLVNGNKITFSRPQIGFTVESYLDMREEEFLADRYHFRGELGRGAFSVVKKATSVKDGTLCAVKIINKAKLLGDPKSQDQVEREIHILRTMRHPNIIGYVDCVDTSTKLYIVLEYADGGELFDHLVKKGAFPEEDAKTIFLQLLKGVSYLHNIGIAHRDLKPENILVHEGKIKITDFGLARLSQNKSFMRTLCGTPQYVAPEIITLASQADNSSDSTDNPSSANGSGAPSSNAKQDPNKAPPLSGYTTAVDMWSLGVILFLLLTGRQPFSSDNSRTISLYSQIENVIYNWPPVDDNLPISDMAKDLVKRLLQARPLDRLSAAQALDHPWLASAIVYQEAIDSQEVELDPAAVASSSPSPDELQANSVVASAALIHPSNVGSPVNPSAMAIDDMSGPNGAQSPVSPGFNGWENISDIALPIGSRKRPYSSMDEPPKPPILPSNSKPATLNGRAPAHLQTSGGNSAAPQYHLPSKFLHTAPPAASSSSAMDTDPPSSNELAYGASAAYIDPNAKRRKLAEGAKK